MYPLIKIKWRLFKVEVVLICARLILKSGLLTRYNLLNTIKITSLRNIYKILQINERHLVSGRRLFFVLRPERGALVNLSRSFTAARTEEVEGIATTKYFEPESSPSLETLQYLTRYSSPVDVKY